MKRFLAALSAIIMCLILCTGVFADRLVVVRDGAELLTYDEQQLLNNMAWDFCDEHNFQIVIVTVNNTGGRDIAEYADEMYDTSGYLEDGVLFMLDMYYREWYISTAGRGIYALSDYNIDCIAEEVVPYLSMGDYYGGFCTFIEECAVYVDDYDSGDYVPDDGDYYEYEYDYDDGYTYKKQGVSPAWIPGSLGIGLLSAFLATGKMKSEMNNVKPQTNASNYAKKGSLNLTEQQDVFLYHTVSRVPKPKDDDRNMHGGGNFGGGVHMSGGGVSHGGHGGHF